MAAIEMPMKSDMAGVTLDVRVTGVRRARVRLWVGARLMRLAAAVIGCDIEITSEATDTDVIEYRPLTGGPVRRVIGKRVRRSI